jgi:hypothetical protein
VFGRGRRCNLTGSAPRHNLLPAAGRGRPAVRTPSRTSTGEDCAARVAVRPRVAARLLPWRPRRDPMPRVPGTVIALARVAHLDAGLERRLTSWNLPLGDAGAGEPLDRLEQRPVLGCNEARRPSARLPRAPSGRCGGRSPPERVAGRSSRRVRCRPRRCRARRCRSPRISRPLHGESSPVAATAGPASGPSAAGPRHARSTPGCAQPCPPDECERGLSGQPLQQGKEVRRGFPGPGCGATDDVGSIQSRAGGRETHAPARRGGRKRALLR